MVLERQVTNEFGASISIKYLLLSIKETVLHYKSKLQDERDRRATCQDSEISGAGGHGGPSLS